MQSSHNLLAAAAMRAAQQAQTDSGTRSAGDSWEANNQHGPVGMLLGLPGPLEQQFWDAPSTQRFLRVVDLIGCSFPLVNILVVALRRIKKLPEQVQLPYGARVMLAVYLSTHLASLVLHFTRPRLYRRHRMAVVKTVRVCRLVSMPATSAGIETTMAACLPVTRTAQHAACHCCPVVLRRLSLSS